MKEIRLTDLRVDGAELDEIMIALRRVLASGWFVLGPEVESFEAELARSVGTGHAVAVASGTDALALGLRAAGIGHDDEVIVPGFTAFPTAAAVLKAGAIPVLVDVEPARPLLDLDATLAAIGRRTRAVILVHLYGVPADAMAFRRALEQRGICLVEDCAQAQGALTTDGRAVGSVGHFGAFSFYPTKNLGAFGDGGAVATNDRDLAAEVRAWRSHGERGQRDVHELPAGNSRLDDLHAAALRLRLRRLGPRLELARTQSSAYQTGLSGFVDHGPNGAPHLAVIQVRGHGPDALAANLAERGVQTGRHYPWALDEQPAMERFPPPSPLTNSHAWAARCLSLPLHPNLTLRDLERVITLVRELDPSQ